MGASKRKGCNRIQGGFVAITFEMINSQAYRKLHVSALKALILCIRKVKTYNPYDRYKFQFSLTYPEAKKQGLWASAFNRGMKQLQEVGFIDVIMRGGMRFQGKACSLYCLSRRWKEYGTPNFKHQHNGYCKAVHGT